MRYLYSTVCNPGANTPYTRGSGAKTYIFTASTPDKIAQARMQIPGYEQILHTRIYQLTYPLHHGWNLEQIRQMFQHCRRCGLCHYRLNTVHFGGAPDARVVFVGQSPGHNEDKQGIPFVGPSGSLLAEMFEETRFCPPFLLTNLVACRPDSGPGTGERADPFFEEWIACSQRLWLTLTAVKPNIVIALGQIPARMFWKNPKKKIQNKLYRVSDKLYIGQTRHPAYHLRKIKKGGIYEYREALDFFRGLSKFVTKLPSFGKDERWSLSEDAPFQFLT